MSRVLEVVVDDPIEVAARRAHSAFRRIGRVDEYVPATHINGRIYTNGYPARVKIRWAMHRDNQRVRLDITATSYDELSRAADTAMYRFARTYKEIDPATLSERDDTARVPLRTVVIVGLLALGLLIAGGIIIGRQTGLLPLNTSGR